MTYVLNEYEWAKEMIDGRNLGDKPFETLCRVAKYYIADGYRGKDLKILLNSFLIKCDPCVSTTKWENTVTKAIAVAQKYKVISIDKIYISDKELSVIRSIGSKPAERLAFTLLCLAKYYDAINPNADHWVNADDSDIMKMANIKTSVRYQSMMYHKLNELGLVQFSKKIDNTNVRVCFIADGETAVGVSDMRNIGYQYMNCIGEKGYIVCQNCGITAQATKAERVAGRKQKYCKECAAEIRIRKTVESAMNRKRAQMQTSVID